MDSKPTLSPKAFNLFLTFQYIPEPSTPVTGIAQIPAGHFMSVTIDNLNPRLKNYWASENLSENILNPEDRIKKSLDKACRLMGSADVPVAVALSGGIDSSLVAAITAKYHHNDLHAFTIGYSGRPSSDERNHAEQLASFLQIKFTSVELGDNDFLLDFPNVMFYMDTPVADIAAYGYFSVSRAARAKGYPVLLSGLGGDEFFGVTNGLGMPWPVMKPIEMEVGGDTGCRS